jgi:hypothetical protein
MPVSTATRPAPGPEFESIPTKQAPLPNLVVLETMEQARALTPFDMPNAVRKSQRRLSGNYDFAAFLKGLLGGGKKRGIDLGAGDGWLIDDVHALLGADYISMTGTESPGSPWLTNWKGPSPHGSGKSLPDYRALGVLSHEQALSRFGDKSMDLVSSNAPFAVAEPEVVALADRFLRDDGVFYFASGVHANLKVAAALLARGYYVMHEHHCHIKDAPRLPTDESCGMAVYASRTPLPGFAYLAETRVFHVRDPELRKRLDFLA